MKRRPRQNRSRTRPFFPWVESSAPMALTRALADAHVLEAGPDERSISERSPSAAGWRCPRRRHRLRSDHSRAELDGLGARAPPRPGSSGSRQAAGRKSFPDEETREQLWRAHLPPSLPIAGPLALEALARKYQIAGGCIRNACLRAAFLAAQDETSLQQHHLERAVALEYAELVSNRSVSGAVRARLVQGPPATGGLAPRQPLRGAGLLRGARRSASQQAWMSGARSRPLSRFSRLFASGSLITS